MSDYQKGIYDLLVDADKRKTKRTREEALRSVGVTEEYFEEGSITIDDSTCRGVECTLCIETCPTSALYRIEGKVEVERDLCILCNACVLNCIVDNCILISRKRKNGEVEQYSTPRDVIILLGSIASDKRREVMKKRISAELSSRKYK